MIKPAPCILRVVNKETKEIVYLQLSPSLLSKIKSLTPKSFSGKNHITPNSFRGSNAKISNSVYK